MFLVRGVDETDLWGERAGDLRGRQGTRARPANDGVQAKREQKLPPQNEGIQVNERDDRTCLLCCDLHLVQLVRPRHERRSRWTTKVFPMC